MSRVCMVGRLRLGIAEGRRLAGKKGVRGGAEVLLAAVLWMRACLLPDSGAFVTPRSPRFRFIAERYLAVEWGVMPV